uniref:Uncharacterized protein n=1 Tax=Opuntia streptacantha TaxID=393608 RepID=A0A7C9E2X6_OPUST
MSLMSSSLGFIPSGRSHLKQWRRFATHISSAYSPSAIPGHDLRPDPNGMNSKLPPLKSGTPSGRNRLGLNDSGSDHEFGSRPIAHALIMTRARLGIWYPPMTAGSAVS